METITKKDLVNRISAETSQTKVVVKDILQRFLEHIIDELGRGNRLEFREFGVFELKERAARQAQNPRTMEKVSVPAKRVVKFKVGRLMRERVSCDDDIDGDDDHSDDDGAGAKTTPSLAAKPTGGSAGRR
ncbi:MAG: integration host factor subunit beta [Planctomycetes bacterium]|nr:integration host factor subunit beta [Planctomycetota bacterium]